MSELSLKVECLPGIKATPQMLLGQVLGDADAIRDVIIFTIEKGDDKAETMALCHTSVSASEMALASVLLAREVHKIADEQDT